MVSRRQGYGVAKCVVVAGKLGSWRIAGTIGATGAAYAAGSDPHVSSGNFYWRRPRGPSSLRASGDRGIRFGGRSRFVPRAGCRSNQKARTISREPAALAAKKDLLL